MTDPDRIKIYVNDVLNFAVSVRCGATWYGYRHSEDVRIIVDRAMDHVDTCERCKEKP